MQRSIVDTANIGDGKIGLSPKSWFDVLSASPTNESHCVSTAESPRVSIKDGVITYTAASGSKKPCTQMSMTKATQKFGDQNFVF